MALSNRENTSLNQINGAQGQPMPYLFEDDAKKMKVWLEQNITLLHAFVLTNTDSSSREEMDEVQRSLQVVVDNFDVSQAQQSAKFQEACEDFFARAEIFSRYADEHAASHSRFQKAAGIVYVAVMVIALILTFTATSPLLLLLTGLALFASTIPLVMAADEGKLVGEESAFVQFSGYAKTVISQNFGQGLFKPKPVQDVLPELTYNSSTPTMSS